jgi:C_GCAxxG_C_C family probable redox protein
MSKIKDADTCFKEGFACSQSVLSAFAPELGLDREMAHKVATSFGGGMGRMGKTCGAVTGAFMVIGLKYGRTRAEDEETKEKAYELVKEFVKRFQERNGSIECRELLGHDMSTPEGYKIIYEKGLTKELCPNFVQDAVEILEQIL